MKGILADNNIQGHLEILLNHWQSDEWREIWQSLQLSVYTFGQLGLAPSVADDVLWLTCQQRQIALVTANRNDDVPNSLEATLRNLNREYCLPVFTIADAQRVQRDTGYAKRVAEKLLEYLFSIERVLGSGRLFVP